MDKKVVIAAAALAGAAVGAVSTYFLTRKSIEKKYADSFDAEVEKARTYYKKLYKQDEFATPEKAAENLHTSAKAVDMALPADTLQEIVSKLEYGSAAVTTVRKPTKSEATRRGSKVTNTYEAEYVPRENPYIVTDEEFMNDDTTRAKISLEYFAVDDVLLDEDEQIIDNVEELVGADNLGRFGFRSNDVNVVYIRNDRLEMDFEVTRREGSYKEMMEG